MKPVKLEEDPAHIYHDGGMLDYHPVPSNFWPQTDGLVLYPHFYDHFKLRWFDKFYPKRKVAAHKLDNVIMLAPTGLGQSPARRQNSVAPRFSEISQERSRAV